MEEIKKSNNARYIVGLILIIIGGIFFLDSVQIIRFDLPDVIFSIPFIIFMIGLLLTISPNNRTLGIVLMLVGGFFLIPKFFPFIHFRFSLIWPILIIALGIYIIIKSRSRFSSKTASSPDEISKDTINDIAIFGGGTKVINSNNFKGGSITSIFGGSEIDLTGCKLAEGYVVIDVLALFGGSEIIVPRDWNVKVSVTSILGGFSNKSRRDPSLPLDDTRTLYIKGFVMFGGGEVKTGF
jgi:predicted membrane protein